MSDEIVITKPTQPSSQPVSVPYTTERIDLPSNGYFYASNDPLSAGYVDMKLMTAREEDILTSQNLIKKGIVLDRLLSSLIVTPGVNVDNLLLADKNALFVAARRLAYGDSYGPLQIKCQKCQQDTECTIDLSKMVDKPYDFKKCVKGKNTFEFVLPRSKKTIVFRLLTSKDESVIDAEIKTMSKMFKSDVSAEVTTRLKKMIVAVDGRTDVAVINAFVDNELLSVDSKALRAYARDMSPELDLAFGFECKHCEHVERMDVPMTVQFFWPES